MLALAVGVMSAGLPLAAQVGGIAGRVVDGRSGLPVSAAEVTVEAWGAATLSLADGTYALEGVPAGPRTVTVRRAGYQEAKASVTVPTDGTATLDAALSRDPLELGARVVSAGTDGEARRRLGYAAATLNVAALAEDGELTSSQDLLSARVPGLRFARLSGNLGTGSPLTLRSVASLSLGRTQPLVYLDGIRVNSDPNSGPTIGSGRNANALDDLGLEDVESLEVLRGPAATSLYGTEGAAGVIQIFTKRGGEGAGRMSVSSRWGWNYMPDPADRLGTMWTCPFDNSPVSSGPFEPYYRVAGVPKGTDDVICNEASELVPYNIYDATNRYIRSGYFPWPARDLYTNGRSSGYDVDLRGGTRTLGYFLSASHDDDVGFLHYNTDEVWRMRANVSVAVTERIPLDVSVAYADGATRFASPIPGDGGEWQDMVWSNGFWLSDITPFDAIVTDSVSGQLTAIADPRRGGYQEKLPSEVAEQISTRAYGRFIGSIRVGHGTNGRRIGAVTASLSQRFVAGIDRQWDVNENIFPLEDGEVPGHLIPYFPVGYRWTEAYSENRFGTAAYERPITTNLSLDYAATASLTVGESWALDTSFGAQYYRQELDAFQNVGEGFASPRSRTINHVSQAGIVTSYALLGSKSIGYHVRQEVAFRDRAFIAGALRVDDNSTFGELVGQRVYPGLSAAWVVSEEDFWSFEPFSTVRVRAAWGRAGRQPSPLANESVYTPWTSSRGLQVIRPTTVGNPLIGPEVTSELELGLDVSALDDRLTGSFTGFWRTTEGAIVEVDLPASPTSITENLGRIRGWGWEAQLSSRVFDAPWISGDLDIALDHVDNRIEDLGGYSGPVSLALGLPYPNQLTDDRVVSARWDPTGSAVNAFGQRVRAMCDAGVTLAPDPSSPDVGLYGRRAGGAVVDCATIPNQWSLVGPAFATYTVTVAPRLRLLGDRLHVFALAEGQYGRWREANDREFSHVYYNSKVSRLQDDPVWVYGFAVGDDTKRSLYDASFWRLREIGARWPVPQAWVRHVGAQRSSVTLSARNPWTLWQAQKRIYDVVISDPELGTPTLDGDANFYETPSMASVNVTVRVTF